MWSYARITVWAIVWLIIWFFIVPFRRKRDNCLTWAMRKYDEEGGYLVIRWARTSRWKWLRWPHFLWLPPDKHKELQHCIPKEDAHTEKSVPTPWFDSEIKQGDEEDDKPEN